MMRHRRYKRAKSLEKYVALPPSYELVLSHDEPPHLDSTLAVTVEEGQTLRLKCTAGEGIDEQTLKFERELEEIKGKRSPRSVSQHIFNFDDAAHSGLYECFARTSSGEEHSRKVRVSSKAVLPKDFVACPTGDDFCGSNGRCGLKNNDKICVCDPGYVGQQCEHLLVKDYLITTAKVVAGAGGTLNVTFIILTLLFATLFLKQRKKLRLLQSQHCCSHDEQKFLVKPQNPYEDPDPPGHEKMAHLTRAYAFDQKQLNRSTRLSAIQRFRAAIRDRLSTKPNGISTDVPAVT
ncbi:hypothetical protein Q1695_006013 [Nippostrongylus brasiliensis]|nr:hypothetical protein Q1695_006013 [Nippostrongylus brasiliensis]